MNRFSKEMNDLVDMEWKSFTVYREFPVENDEKKALSTFSAFLKKKNA